MCPVLCGALLGDKEWRREPCWAVTVCDHVLCARKWAKCFCTRSHCHPPGPFIVPILQMRKQGLGDIGHLSQCHPFSRQQSQDLNPRKSDSVLCALRHHVKYPQGSCLGGETIFRHSEPCTKLNRSVQSCCRKLKDQGLVGQWLGEGGKEGGGNECNLAWVAAWAWEY